MENLNRFFEKATRDDQKIIVNIIQNYAPLRVIQLGLLIQRKKICEFSDIDIALEVIFKAEDYFRLLGDASSRIDSSVDIVQLEKIETEFV